MALIAGIYMYNYSSKHVSNFYETKQFLLILLQRITCLPAAQFYMPFRFPKTHQYKRNIVSHTHTHTHKVKFRHVLLERVKKNELHAQLILSIFRSTSTCFGCIYAHHQEVQLNVYNWYLLFFLDDCLLCWLDCSNPTSTTDNPISTNCCIHTVVPPDDGHRYARKM